MEDEAIIALLWSRNEQGISELDNKYGKTCRLIARNILGNVSDAEECVSDGYLAVWNTIPPQKPNPLRTYLFRIIRNRSIARYHTNTARKRNTYYDVSLEELSGCIPSTGSVEQALEAKELAALLDRFLDQQDGKSRFIFVRRYWYCDHIDDIAEGLRMRPNTVSVNLSRTRKRLRKFLEKEGYFL